MRTETQVVKASDGAELFQHRFSPEDREPRGAVYVSHGMAEHAGRYAPLAEALAAAGWAVRGHDHRGHGKTAKPGELGWFGPGGWQRVVDDLAKLLEQTRADFPSKPVVLFGHSMGSFVAQQLAWQEPALPSGLVLSGSAGKPNLLAQAGRLVTRAERLRVGERGTSKLLQALSFGAYNKAFGPTRTDFDWLSRDAAEVDKYVADPLCGFPVSVSLWQELLDALPAIHDPARQARIRRDLPVLVIAGSLDPVGEKGKSVLQLVEEYRAAGVRDLEHKLYEGARHEIVNETNRAEVLADVVAWLGRRFP